MKKVFLTLLALCAFAATDVFAQDPGPTPGPVPGTTTTVKVIVEGIRVNPDGYPAICDPGTDTCFVFYVRVTTGTTATGSNGVAVGIYSPSDRRGFANVTPKISYNYKQLIVSVTRTADTKEVATEEELEKALLRPDEK